MKKAIVKRELGIHVGENFPTVAARVAKAWRRAEHGEDVRERHVTFATWEALSAVMTPKRYELLRYVRLHPARSVAALARDIGRDYKRVHEDVAALTGIGLIERGIGIAGLRAPFDQIQTTISI